MKLAMTSGRSVISDDGASPAVSPGRRIFLDIFWGNVFYFLVIYSFPIFEELLQETAYRVTPNPSKYFIGAMIVSALALVLATSVPSHRSLVGLFSQLCFTLLFVPLCAAYAIIDGNVAFPLSCGMSLALCFVIFGRLGPVPLVRNSPADWMLMLVFLVIMVTVLVDLAIRGELKVQFVSFYDVYDLRSAAQDGYSLVAARSVTIAAYTAASYVLIYGILYRNPIYVSLSLFTSYAMYSTFAFKLFLFFPLISIALYFYFTANRRHLIVSGLSFLFLIIIILDRYDLSILEIVNGLIVRRYIYAPSFISYAWYETFVNEPKYLMENVGVIRYFVGSYYSEPNYIIVAQNIYGKEFNPNTSVMGYGYANFGHFGVAISTLAVFACLSMIDAASRLAKSAYCSLGACAPTFLFLEADFLVVVVSFGFGIAVISSLLVGGWNAHQSSRMN